MRGHQQPAGPPPYPLPPAGPALRLTPAPPQRRQPRALGGPAASPAPSARGEGRALRGLKRPGAARSDGGGFPGVVPGRCRGAARDAPHPGCVGAGQGPESRSGDGPESPAGGYGLGAGSRPGTRESAGPAWRGPRPREGRGAGAAKGRWPYPAPPGVRRRGHTPRVRAKAGGLGAVMRARCCGVGGVSAWDQRRRPAAPDTAPSPGRRGPATGRGLPSGTGVWALNTGRQRGQQPHRQHGRHQAQRCSRPLSYGESAGQTVCERAASAPTSPCGGSPGERNKEQKGYAEHASAQVPPRGPGWPGPGRDHGRARRQGLR